MFSYILFASLNDTTDKNKMILKVDPEFGQHTDWGKIFHDTHKGMTVTSDGSIFVVNQDQHNILKFDKFGNLEKKFGKQGQRPGELFYPGSISILDKTFLVVGDFPKNRKLTLFDLEGNFKRIVKINNPAFSIVSLKNKKVAYIFWRKKDSPDKEETKKEISIYIKDIESGDETFVISYIVPDPGLIDIKGKARIATGTYYTGDVFIECTIRGNLLVGLSTSRKIDIYSRQGDRIKTFSLKMDAPELTDNFKEEFRQSQINRFKTRNDWNKIKDEFINKISSDRFFNQKLPYFRKILVDNKGNILFFKERSSFQKDIIRYQVYSEDGDLKDDKTLDFGEEYKLDGDSLRWFRRIYFSDNGITALVEPQTKKDFNLKIIKAKF